VDAAKWLKACLTLQQAIDHNTRILKSGGRRNGLRIQGVDVLASGQDTGIADRVTARSRLDVLAGQSFTERAQLVVLHHLSETELDVIKNREELQTVRGSKFCALQRLITAG